jgi:hypothetical protein
MFSGMKKEKCGCTIGEAERRGREFVSLKILWQCWVVLPATGGRQYDG